MGLFSLIDKFHTWSNSLIAEKFPLISLYYYTKPRAFLYTRQLPIHKLYKGKLSNNCQKKSALFFTVHKSASTFFNWYLPELCQQTGHTYIDVNGYFVTQGEEGRRKQNEPQFKNKVFKEKGFIYGPLRNYIAVDKIENYPVVLILRDPRDVLTSQFFSIKNSHPLLTPELIKRRQFAKNATIDEHVLSQADRFVNTYNDYLDNIYGKENVLFIKYEDMILNFRLVLTKINTHCDLQLTEEQINLLDKSDSFKSKAENQKQHIRKISSGDYKEKLKPETIELLNKKFELILKRLNYSL